MMFFKSDYLCKQVVKVGYYMIWFHLRNKNKSSGTNVKYQRGATCGNLSVYRLNDKNGVIAQFQNCMIYNEWI